MARPREGHVVVAIEGPNAKEAAAWAEHGRSWLAHEATQNRLLVPVTEALLDMTNFQAGQRVLDIGCGTGAHAIAVAQAVQPDGAVVALDVSQPFLERVAERAASASLAVETLYADAQVADWDRTFDVLTSRFGVMFFQDTAAAFANMAKALSPGGRMVFAAWAPAEVNPFWRLPIVMAKQRLGIHPEMVPNAPGPLGLSNVEFVAKELDKAGLDGAVTRHTIRLGTLGNARDTAEHYVRIGPAARVLRLAGSGETERSFIVDAMAEALGDYEDAGQVLVPATLNIIEARLA